MTGPVRIGVDVGGTFTDVVTVDDGRLTVSKTPTVPDSPAAGVAAGLDAAVERAAIRPSAVEALGHGTTVTTNAVLERDWAETALVTTEGFRDVLEIARQDRPALYDLDAEKPPPIVDRSLRFGVAERLDERGEVVEALDEAAVRAVADELDEADVESLAVSFLFAFESADHECRARAVLDEAGLDVPVSLSSDVLPEIREYERTLATALNAALVPVIDHYLGRLGRKLDDRGIGPSPWIMQSNAGVTTAVEARRRPVETLLSGPAAGVRGAAFVAGLAGLDDVITMDMGGTSCDVSVVRGGEPVVSNDVTVGGYPVGVPAVDVHTIGAGGGSIGWVDAGGALRVGPRSAGADPGPVCYGRGGCRPTVTDAHFLLGRIDPGAFGHGFDADPDAVRGAVREGVADPLGMTVDEAAGGLLDVANANMARALRVVSVERGHDPRRLGLVAYGGAGPLHATRLAAELGIPTVVVPRAAGVLSALGLVSSDLVHRFGTSRIRPWSAVESAALAEAFDRFEAAGRERLDDAAVPRDRQTYERSLDVRYAGQAYDLSVPVEGALDGDALATAAERFHGRHLERYGHASPDEPVELVGLGLTARGRIEPPNLAEGSREGSLDDARTGERRVGYAGRRLETPVYRRERLPIGADVDGPAVVEGSESTTLLRPGQRADVDRFGNLVVEVG